MKKTDMPQVERIIRLYSWFIRNPRRSFSVNELYSMINNYDLVELRNVQRDLKWLTDLENISHIQKIREKGKVRYRLEPYISFAIPPETNKLLALILIRKLQPFISKNSETIEQIDDLLFGKAKEEEYKKFEDLDERFSANSVHLGDRASLSPEPEMFATMIGALVEKRKLKITYIKPGSSPEERSISPVKLLLNKNELYFICISSKHKGVNYFIKLSRILKAEKSPEVFTPTKEDLAGIERRLKNSFGILDNQDARPVPVEIRFPAWFDAIVNEKIFHHSQSVKREKDGSVLLQMKVPLGKELINWVLGWGESAEVIKPQKLREHVLEVVELLAKKYRK